MEHFIAGFTILSLACVGGAIWAQDKYLLPHEKDGYIAPQTAAETAPAESVPTTTVVELAPVKEQLVPAEKVALPLAA